MSEPLFKDDILFTQRILTVSGFYKGLRNGVWNAQCDAAELAFDAKAKSIAAADGTFDPRSETAIATLLPAAQQKCREFMTAAAGWTSGAVKVLSGTRTYAEQNALYAKGRTKPGPKVTNARGGQSNHNFGIAWDIGIFVNGKYYTGDTAVQDKAYIDFATYIMAKVKGLSWGGNWKSFKDKPHYQLVAGDDVANCRKCFEAGKPYV